MKNVDIFFGKGNLTSKKLGGTQPHQQQLDTQSYSKGFLEFAICEANHNPPLPFLKKRNSVAIIPLGFLISFFNRTIL